MPMRSPVGSVKFPRKEGQARENPARQHHSGHQPSTSMFDNLHNGCVLEDTLPKLRQLVLEHGHETHDQFEVFLQFWVR